MPTDTFSQRVLAFYETLDKFRWVTPDVAVLSPLNDEKRTEAVRAFYEKFFSDNDPRVYWLGINPSRVRRTSTGVPYTDGFALETFCGIENDFDKRRELTSDFFYRFVEAYGGSAAFYKRHYPGAAFPLSILRKDKYCNYYDRDLPAEFSESVPGLLKQQAEIGSAGVLIIIGSGDNARILGRLNDELKLFNVVHVVEHPRYIMQYKSADLDSYVAKYVDLAREAEKAAGL